MFLETFNNLAIVQTWEFWVGTIIFSLIAYLIGSVNAGQILSRIWKKDLGSEGSKNYGATNAGRIYGKIGFIIVLFTDMGKGVFTGVLLGILSEGKLLGYFNEASISIALTFVIVGHMWPLYFKFKGGKGVAAAAGVFFTINWVISLILLVIILLSLPFTTRVSLSSTVAAISLLALSRLHPKIPHYLLFDFATVTKTSWPISDGEMAMYISSTLVIIRHIPNYILIAQGKHIGSLKLRLIRYKIFHPFSKKLPIGLEAEKIYRLSLENEITVESKLEKEFQKSLKNERVNKKNDK